jgi:ferric-dicitrate binding protein FerR (iron transport regulator)
MTDNRSGSRWEPDPAEQPTGRLAGPVIPGMQEEPSAPAPASPKRRIPRAAAAVAIVAAATIAGGAVGLALAGNNTQEASDTAVAGESGTDPAVPDVQDSDGFERHGPGGHFGHHGPGRH